MLRRQKRRKKSRNGTKGAAQGPFVSLKVAVKSAVLRMKDEGRDTGNSFEKMVVTAANDAYMDDMIELPQSLRVTPFDLEENKMRIWLTHSSKTKGRKLTAVSSMEASASGISPAAESSAAAAAAVAEKPLRRTCHG